MIELKGISRVFHRGEAAEVKALKNITLNVGQGDFVIIVGSNGSGKSTLLNVIAGSTMPSSGSICIAGENVTKLEDYQRSKWIARVFQDPLTGTAAGLSITDNFRLAAIRSQRKGLSIGVKDKFIREIKDKIAMLGLGLEDKTAQNMGTLSGGQRQALTLLMSVMDSCKILLLDEPTAALDPRSAEIVMKTADKIIRDFGLTAILITHNLKEAYTYGNRIIQMADGEIAHDLGKEQKFKLTQNDLFEWFS